MADSGDSICYIFYLQKKYSLLKKTFQSTVASVKSFLKDETFHKNYDQLKLQVLQFKITFFTV